MGFFAFERAGNLAFLMAIMKRCALQTWAAVGLSGFMATVAYRALADDTSAKATAAKPEKTYTGTVVSVDPQDHMLNVRGFLFNKKFNLGDSCAYTMVGQTTGAVGDLRPGQRVTVSYQDANGVLVADRVTQKPLCETGMVKAIDPAQHTVTLHLRMMDKTFQLPADCQVTLRGGRSGSLGDIQTGDHVTVTYEIPNGKPTAREIAQTSATFTGDLTAIDLGQKTLKAKAAFATKKFSLGDNCAIVINGKPDGKLTDLRPGENLTFSYDVVNGVNIVNRIAPAGTEPATQTETMQSPPR
jgi:Cu/Ag efflux protein CusF